MGKAGPPMRGKDLHTGDFAWGVLPAAAPLSIGSLSMAGMAMAFWREDAGRVAFSFIGEGGSSLGEWHEAINLCAARRLPAVFCVENNQTALSTPVPENSAARVFADKAIGYGIPGITVDGTDADAVAAAFTWAADRARSGAGPALIELVSMRMCGHAHHDDMFYLGKELPPSWDYPPLHDSGYAVRELYEFWAARDPIARYAARLEAERVINHAELARLQRWAEQMVEAQAQRVIAEPWPEPDEAGVGVFKDEPPRVRIEVLEPSRRAAGLAAPPLPPLEPTRPFDKQGSTLLDAVMLGVGDALRADPRVFVYGEDVGGTYGNAFLLLRPLLEEFGERILNSPLAEGAVLGVCVGAALAGQRPIGEMQFNDFVATGFNQLVNNAAKIRYRWGGEVPMVVRMPWGGLRYAGPYHSQNTEPWFYRTPGLKIVVPVDARGRSRPDGGGGRRSRPGPLLRAHRPLPRSAHQAGARRRRAGRRRRSARRPCAGAGTRLALISYGAYVHECLRVADTLAARRHRGRGARPAHAGPARSRRRARGGEALRARARRPRGLAHRRDRRERRRDRPGRGVRVARRARCGCWARSTRRCPTRRRSRSSSWSAPRRSSARRGCSPPTDCRPSAAWLRLGALAGERGGALPVVHVALDVVAADRRRRGDGDRARSVPSSRTGTSPGLPDTVPLSGVSPMSLLMLPLTAPPSTARRSVACVVPCGLSTLRVQLPATPRLRRQRHGAGDDGRDHDEGSARHAARG